MAGAVAARRASAIVLACLLAFPAQATAEEDDEGDEDLRQRLTEREDKRRPLESWSIDVVGRPLTVSGEYELGVGYLRRRVLGNEPGQPDRLLLEQQLEVEAFYSIGPPLSLFAQIRLAMEEDLLPDTFEDVSDYFVERGETWLYSEEVAGTPLDFDIGRLHFEDERRWWWDEDLDALRFAFEGESFVAALALARELGPDRSDQDHVDPEHDRVLRVIAEASWDWRPNHTLALFALYQGDRSSTERAGQRISCERADDSDGRLGWLGARLMGAFDLSSRGIAGYWLDAALVRGDERTVEFEEEDGRCRVDEELGRRDVEGWAIDAGATWILPLAHEPRVFAGYAFGSGDSKPETGDDRAFRQTGIEANEAGFGGVERFAHYGVLLDPELSNLQVLTVGAGLSLLRSSSLDLVYHHYRLVELATSLRGSRLEASLIGDERDVGDEVDLVLALEEWQRLEFEFVASAFRPGRAFGDERGAWSYGAAFAARFAF